MTETEGPAELSISRAPLRIDDPASLRAEAALLRTHGREYSDQKLLRREAIEQIYALAVKLDSMARAIDAKSSESNVSEPQSPTFCDDAFVESAATIDSARFDDALGDLIRKPPTSIARSVIWTRAK